MSKPSFSIFRGITEGRLSFTDGLATSPFISLSPSIPSLNMPTLKEMFFKVLPV